MSQDDAPEFEAVLSFARDMTVIMAKQLQQTVTEIRKDPRATLEYRVRYARIMREQSDLVLAAAEALERP